MLASVRPQSKALATSPPSGAPFSDLLLELGAKDERVVVLAADLGRYVDVMPFADAYPKRFWNLGAAEANLIGIASGLAKSGFKPIVVTYGVFLSRRSYDQVAMSLTTGPTGVVLVGFLPGITCRFRATHQPVDDMALLGSLPTMSIIDPADDADLQHAVRKAVQADHPTFIRAMRGNQPPLERTNPDGSPVLVRRGRGARIGMIGCGLGTQWALQAADVLAGRGLDLSILHVPTVKPLDHAAILQFCADHDRVYTVENHFACGGLHAVVAQVVVASDVVARVRCIAVPNDWPPGGTVEYIRSQIGLSAEQIADRISKEQVA